MKNMIAISILSVTGCVACASAGEVAFSDPVVLSCTEMESFLLHAKPGPMRNLSVGVTNSHRITLSDGNMEHDGHVQTVDEKKSQFEGAQGAIELNFRDSYKYNIAAYELAKLLGLNMVPPYVERRVGADTGSLSWWVNNTMMEAERYKKAIPIPDADGWNKQMYAVRVFHELVYDTDPNLTNLLITKSWQLWIIDLTRAFRTSENLREPKNLVKCDRRLLNRMREIDAGTLKQSLGSWLTKTELRGLEARRAKIVRFFEKEIHSKGEAAVLYDFQRTSQSCGTGL